MRKRYADTRITKKEEVCVDGRHNDKIFLCKWFKRLKLHERKAVLERLAENALDAMMMMVTYAETKTVGSTAPSIIHYFSV